MSDVRLIAAFVAAFQYDQFFTHNDPPPEELSQGIDPDDWACLRWEPAQLNTPHDQYQALCRKIDAKLPPLYEQLITTWRWLDVWLGEVRLFSNPPDTTLEPLRLQMMNDPVFCEHLVANGFIPFGLDIDAYNPICFDTNKSQPDGDCPIRKFEHEAMLTYNRIGESWQLWPSCRTMMQEAVK